MKNKKVSVIIPTYNEKGNVIRLISDIKKTFLNLEYGLEIIVVDDNSPDKTADEVRKRFEKDRKVRLFVRKGVRGLATAILLGIKKAKGEIILGMDADYNHQPKHIPSMLSALENSDLVVASRFIKGGGMADKKRYWGTLSFNIILHFILGFPTMDNMSGFYAVKREKLFSLPLLKIYRGYGEYHLRLVYLAKQKGYRISQVPCYYPERRYGVSKSRISDLLFTYFSEAVKLSLGKR